MDDASQPPPAHSESGESGIGGINVLELTELTPPQRKIMRIMLRKLELDHVTLCALLSEGPPEERLSQEDIDQALVVLLEQRWLVPAHELTQENEPKLYRLNFRRRANRVLTQVTPRRRNSTGPSIWDALESSGSGTHPSPTLPDPDKPQ